MSNGDIKKGSRDGSGNRAEERERIVAAFTKAASEQGYAKLTLAEVLRHAGVSQATFDAHFASMEQGLLAAQEAFLDQLRLDALGACETSTEWPQKVRAAVRAILGSVVEASGLARVLTVEAAATSMAAAERQMAALDQFAGLLREGRRHYPRSAELPDATERAMIAGIFSLVSGHLLMEEPQNITTEEGELVELLLGPYLGLKEARRIAAG